MEKDIELPQINDIVTTPRALELCAHFKLAYLVERIKTSPDKFHAWKFDGCSCLPDEVLGLFTGCDWQAITYQCCLPHDLRYAYGETDNKAERKRADTLFFSDLVTRAGMKKWMARAFLAGVRAGGSEAFGLSFSWGFARRKNQ